MSRTRPIRENSSGSFKRDQYWKLRGIPEGRPSLWIFQTTERGHRPKKVPGTPGLEQLWVEGRSDRVVRWFVETQRWYDV